MLRHSFTAHRLFALLLPLAFIWGWVGCVSVCGEITAQHNHATVEQNGESCAGIMDKADGCTITTNAVVLQERQIVKTTAPLATPGVPVSQFRAPTPAWAALLPEIKQNSPPKFVTQPVFLRLCTFRI